jgi:hypothetical protein
MATSFDWKIVGGYDRDKHHGLTRFHEQITIKSFFVQYLKFPSQSATVFEPVG